MTAGLECTVQRFADHVLVTLTGELDVSSRDTLIHAVSNAIEDGAELVKIDLSGLAFCDSNGLSALIAAHRIGAAAGRRVSIVAVSPQVRNLLAVSGLYDRLSGEES